MWADGGGVTGGVGVDRRASPSHRRAEAPEHLVEGDGPGPGPEPVRVEGDGPGGVTGAAGRPLAPAVCPAYRVFSGPGRSTARNAFRAAGWKIVPCPSSGIRSWCHRTPGGASARRTSANARVTSANSFSLLLAR